MSEFKFPTEEVELPSKGLVYPKDNPLSSGKIEMKYMTAKEEDILTNQNYIKQGTVIDKLLKALIVSKVNYDDLVVGDKNAVLISARILGYGKDYSFTYKDEEITIDLTDLETRYLEGDTPVSEFTYTLPHTNTVITYKLLTNKDEKKIQAEIKGLRKINKQASPELSTRLKYMITSVNGEEGNKEIREFVDNYMLARDSKAFRDHIRTTQPDVIMKFDYDGIEGSEEDVTIPMTAGFFWPDA
jgi:hypothetical protein|tara:strand:- start:892 stop:1620 length:729 start_codon:yes stop_codon:yes gene_type:complete